MASLPFALQLYTVRDHLQKDPARTVEQVKAIGYDNIEMAGTCGLTHEDFKALLDKNGLKAISSHVGLDDMAKDFQHAVDAARLFGYRFVAFSGNAPDRDGWIDLARKADTVGERLRAEGVQLCYHNHAHEFVAFDGVTALDTLLTHAHPENLAAQIDVYWAQYGGVDPVRLINEYQGRCPLLHIKDMTATEPRTFAEVGRGTLDMPAIFKAGAEAGTEWYIVEQDTCAGDSLESARISAEYMRRKL